MSDVIQFTLYLENFEKTVNCSKQRGHRLNVIHTDQHIRRQLHVGNSHFNITVICYQLDIELIHVNTSELIFHCVIDLHRYDVLLNIMQVT